MVLLEGSFQHTVKVRSEHGPRPGDAGQVAYGAFTERPREPVAAEDLQERVVEQVGEFLRHDFGGLLELVPRKQGIDIEAETGLIGDVLEQPVPTRVTEIERKTRANEWHQPMAVFQEKLKV